jgi:hypothetical protein
MHGDDAQAPIFGFHVKGNDFDGGLDIKGHHVAASKDNSGFVVNSDKSDGIAAHKPDNLKKL